MKTRLTHPLVRLAFAVALLVFAGASLCQAQITVYAKFLDGTGVWAGESTAPGRTGWAELSSLSFGGSNAVTLSGAGGGASVGPHKFDDIVLTKHVDRLSPQIFITLAGGTPLTTGSTADVTFEFVRTAAAGPVTFFRVEYMTAYFKSLKSSSAAGDDSLIENVTLLAGSVRITYWPILANGSQGTPIVRMWNAITNTPTF